MEDNFSTDGGGGGGVVQAVMRATGSDEEPQMKLRGLARRSLLTSCCAARFLTGCGPVPSAAWGLGSPALEAKSPRSRALWGSSSMLALPVRACIASSLQFSGSNLDEQTDHLVLL